ncbi:MAG: cytochrome c [Bacteroidota bacterium]
MKKILTITIPLAGLMCLLVALSAFTEREEKLFNDDTPVYQVLQDLGEKPSKSEVDPSVEGASAERGEALVTTGVASKPGGGKTRKQSKHFVCTSCHNIQKEDPDLRYSDPETRLTYAVENDLPFLQGTTLYGAVNRESFYNGDYDKKYGDLVADARNDIRGAIQLCAEVCAQGRPLNNWEMESVVAYLWTLQLKMGDLSMSENEKSDVNSLMANAETKEDAKESIRSFYLQGSPATFADSPDNHKDGFSLTGNADRGQAVYENSCLHCHSSGKYAFFELDKGKTSRQFLNYHFGRYTRYSMYNLAVYGTSPLPGKRTYMPNYPKERLSQQQIEDLRAYFSSK